MWVMVRILFAKKNVWVPHLFLKNLKFKVAHDENITRVVQLINPSQYEWDTSFSQKPLSN